MHAGVQDGADLSSPQPAITVGRFLLLNYEIRKRRGKAPRKLLHSLKVGGASGALGPALRTACLTRLCLVSPSVGPRKEEDLQHPGRCGVPGTPPSSLRDQPMLVDSFQPQFPKDMEVEEA